MAHCFEIEIPPEQQPLFRALSERGLSVCPALQALMRLTEPPESLRQPPSDHVDRMNSLIEATVDLAAEWPRECCGSVKLAPNQTQHRRKSPPPSANEQSVVGHGHLTPDFNPHPQGRPSVIDSALVIFCSRVIAESCKQPRFQFSRRTGGGPPKGPMWSTLMIALPLAETYLARFDGTISAPRPRRSVPR